MRNRKHTPHPQPLSFEGAPSLSLGQTQGSNFVSSPSSEHPRYRWGRPGDGGGAAFTLVELIVVVTILAILATIGFVSYSSYLTGVRDTNRIAQMTSLSDGLNLYSTRNDLPIPEDNVEVSVNGNLIAYQGYAGTNILETINFEKGGVDPKDNTYFSYYLTSDRKYFQLMGFLEESADLTTLIPNPSPLEEKGASIVSLSPKGVPSLSLGQTQGIQGGGLFGLGVSSASAANYQDRIPTVIGKKLGILTDLENNPVQEGGADLNITPTTTGFNGYIDNEIIYTDTELVLINPNANCKRIRETTTQRKDGAYTINPDGTEFEVYCDMTTDGGGWTYSTMLADDTTENLFDTGNTDKIQSLTSNISTKGALSNMWIDDLNKDILIKCESNDSTYSSYSIPIIIYEYLKSDINNLEKAAKAGTTFSSSVLNGSWDNKDITFNTTYGPSGDAASFYLTHPEGGNIFMLWVSDRIAKDTNCHVNSPCINDTNINSFLSNSQYCMTAIR